MKTLLVTGGAGFIGSSFVHYWRREHSDDRVIVFDSLTYAGNLSNLDGVDVAFERGDVCDSGDVRDVLIRHQVDEIVHFAGETHVDKSIHGPKGFLVTNVLGVEGLLRAIVEGGTCVKKIVHVSTDEVMGPVAFDATPLTEEASLKPSSPYAASKAGGELLALAYYRTYGTPVVVARPTNVYGPRQHPEKLIPTVILRTLRSEAVPIYGDGQQIREWLYVNDLCRAVDVLLNEGLVGEVYHVGGGRGYSNLDLVKQIFEFMTITTGCQGKLEYVTDRLGHDRRYAVDSSKMRNVGWEPRISLRMGLEAAVAWYVRHETWWKSVVGSEEHQAWVKRHYQ